MKIIWLLFLALCCTAHADDFDVLVRDRAAIERVYYNHRTGQKPPFEETLSRATLENLARLDLKKETALQKIYSITISPALLDSEVQRINATTRAPEMLAEIKTALGNDPARFGNVFAKPFLVERLLREKFNNDDSLHAEQRHQAEGTRNQLLAAKKRDATYEKLLALLKESDSNAVTEITWQLGAHPSQTNAPAADEIEIKKRFGPNAQILSSPQADGKDRKFYFEDMPEQLQDVLRAQLRLADDVSAVIETPSQFLVYVAKQKTSATLSVAAWSISKRSYDQWLHDLP